MNKLEKFGIRNSINMKDKTMIIKNILRSITILLLVTLLPANLFAQSDSRYDSGLNLPFNQKAGDVNPQTGNITLSVTDVALPGRAGLNFTFSRIWSLNQSNVFNMNQSQIDGLNYLSADTIEKYNHMGVGWSTSLPYIFTDENAPSEVKSLFLNGSVYELDTASMPTYGDNESNIKGYDLLDLRVFSGDVGDDISYSDFGTIPGGYGIDDLPTDFSRYVLILKDNSKYYFRPDGKIMMQQDKTGLNRIWYFYEEYEPDKTRLVQVVDTIGRYINFSYNITTGNLESIAWQVGIGKIDSSDEHRYFDTTVDRSVHYSYSDAVAEYPAIAGLVGSMPTPYVLETVTDVQGNVTLYEYETGLTEYSFNSAVSSSDNVYLMLTSITSMYTIEGFKNKRCFEYELSEKNKEFYLGYMEYYKISRQYYKDRHDRTVGETFYSYYKPGDECEHNEYKAVVETGNVTTTYTYSLSELPSRDNVLSSMSTSTTDGFLQSTSYTYTNDRTLDVEEVRRNGNWVYSEEYDYDKKGNLTKQINRRGLEVRVLYDDVYSIPLETTKTLYVDGIKKTYKTKNTIDTLGQITEQIMYVDGNSISTAFIVYDEFGNVTRQTDADNNTVHTEYDSLYTAFPINTWTTVTIDKWDGGDIADNWKTPPDNTETVKARSWKVFNTDGTVWIEVDNEGYALEHYYDAYGREIETVNPGDDDVQVPEGEDHSDFRDFTTYASFLASRVGNPGVRMEINYQNDFIKTYADVDKGNGSIKITGVRGDGLGNTEEEIEYDATEQVYSVKTMTYDALGRMVALTDPDAGTTFTEHTVNDTLVKRYDKTWIVKYDDLGRKETVIYPDTTPGKIDMKTITYDDFHNTVTTTDPEGRTVIEKMDWNGNLVELEHRGDADTPASAYQHYTYEYDMLDRKIAFTDPKGIVTTYRYDERNLLVEQNFGTSGSDVMEYNDLGQLVKKTDRNNRVSLFTYDEMGRNTKLTHYTTYIAEGDPGNVEEYSVNTVYDFRGNAVRIDNQNLIEYYEYDFGNRVKSLDRYIKDETIREETTELAGITYSNSTSDMLDTNSLTDSSALWEVDSFIGYILKVNDGRATITGNSANIISFDDLTSTITDTGAGFGYEIINDIFEFKYEYNDAGMVTKMIYPDGSDHNFTYDEALARLETIKNGTEDFITDLDYNKSGVVKRMDYENDTWQTWEFDNRKRIAGISINHTSGEITNLDYTLNGSGDILTINENEYGYDGFDRIVSAKTLIPGQTDLLSLVRASFGTAVGADPIEVEGEIRTYNALADTNLDGAIDGLDHAAACFIGEDDVYDIESFQYDKNGNRTKLTQNGDQYLYTYGERNRLVTVHRKKKDEAAESLYVEYEYDNCGNTTRRTIYKEEGEEVIVFEYDTMNRLVKTTEDTDVTEYYYDNAGNRFIKVSPAGTTVYLRHGQIAVAMDIELPADTSEELGRVNRYVLSGDLLAGRITTIVPSVGDPTVEKSYYHLDHLNSTKCVTDEDGVVVVMYEYRAFGEQLKRLDANGSDTDDSAKYSYGGKELDDGTNLYYFNARYYDATIGRFINVDPVQDGGNWYVYCGNNPMAMVDPTGLMDFFIYFEAEIVPVFAGIELSGGVVYDSDTDSGDFFGSLSAGANSFGLSAGAAFGIGAVQRDVEGESTNLDFNIGIVSITLIFDDNGFNGFSVTAGPGAGGSISKSTTVSTYKEEVEPATPPGGAIPPGAIQAGEDNSLNSPNPNNDDSQ